MGVESILAPFMQQADLYIVAVRGNARSCRESRFDTRSQWLPFAGSRRPARVTSYTRSCEASSMP